VAPPAGSGNPVSTPFPWRPVALGGSGAVALIGIILLGVAPGVKSSAEKDAPKDIDGNLVCSKRGPMYDKGGGTDCNKIRSQTSSADAMSGAGGGLLAIGLLAAAGIGAHWYLTGRQAEPAKPASRLVPVVGADRAGLVWQGSF